MRNWPVRRQVAAVLLLPLLAMMVLVGYFGVGELTTARAAGQAGDAARWLIKVNNLVEALQAERLAVADYVQGGRRDAQGVEAMAVAAERVRAAYHEADVTAATLELSRRSDVAAAVDAAREAVAVLAAVRSDLAAGRLIDPLPYTRAIESWLTAESLLTRVLAPGSGVGESSERLAGVAAALSAIAWASEQVSVQYLEISVIVSRGEATPDSIVRVRTAIGSEQSWLTQFRANALPEQAELYDNSVEFATADFAAVRNLVLYGGASVVTASQWAADGGARLEAVRSVQSKVVSDLEAISAEAVQAAQFRALIALIFASVGITTSMAISLLVAGRLVRTLRALRDGSLRAARERLPEVTSAIRSGQVIDPATEPPPFPSPGHNEMGEVAAATNALYGAAVAATYEVASVRSVGEVLRTLARRSLHLTRRQLKMITDMERDQEDPQLVAKLFGIDHQATRMRRLAESLLVLAGDQPHRPNRQPAALFDVLRAAAAEVEDYSRVHIAPTGVDVSVAGAAVGDLVHILAELIENAIAYSPDATQVEVRAGRVAYGWSIEVEDRGIGLDDATLQGFNQRLADPPPFEAGGSGQIGLTVVARLAARHGILVRLRRGAYEGIQAIVVLPAAILSSHSRPGGPDNPHQTMAAARTGRHSRAELYGPTAEYAIPVSGLGAVTPQPRSPFGQPSHGQGPAPAPGRPASLPDLPTRVRGAQMADKLRTGPPEAVPRQAAARPPEHARWLASGFMNGFERGRQAASPENTSHRPP